MHKTFETSSNFHVKQRTTGRVQGFFASTNKIFISGGGL